MKKDFIKLVENEYKEYTEQYGYQEHINMELINYPEIYYHPKKKRESIDRLCLEISIDRGGRRGGNCWNDEIEEYSGHQGALPDFNDFIYSVLGQINDQMPFLFVHQVIKNCTERDEEINREYYGNYHTCEKIKFDFLQLYKKLEEAGYINEPSKKNTLEI